MPVGDTLTLTVAPDDLHRARRALTRWLIDRGIAELSACDIVLAAAEAATESIAHGAARITVTATITALEIVVTVDDDGRLHDPDTGALRGNALVMVEAASTHYEITHDDASTTLTARFPLETP